VGLETISSRLEWTSWPRAEQDNKTDAAAIFKGQETRWCRFYGDFARAIHGIHGTFGFCEARIVGVGSVVDTPCMKLLAPQRQRFRLMSNIQMLRPASNKYRYIPNLGADGLSLNLRRDSVG
jgi:hypothetical protein